MLVSLLGCRAVFARLKKIAAQILACLNVKKLKIIFVNIFNAYCCFFGNNRKFIN